MNASTHLDWAMQHAKAFGLRTEHDAEMVVAWANAFQQTGFTVSELAEASRWMLTESAPRFREQHLDMIQKRITAKRSEIYRESVLASQRRDWQSSCMHCDGSGLVIVPHPSFFIDGRWSAPWPTAAVTCMCSRGEKASRDACERKMPMLSLLTYESSRSDWREQVSERERTRAILCNARTHTRSVDGSLGSVLGEVIKKQAAKRAA